LNDNLSYIELFFAMIIYRRKQFAKRI